MKKSRLSVLSGLLLGATTVLLAVPASADVIFTYDVNGAYSVSQTLPAGTLSGTLTVDATTSSVTGVDIHASGISGSFTQIVSPLSSLGADLVVELENTIANVDFFLQLKTEATLFNGQTTTIDAFSVFTGGGFTAVDGNDGGPFSGSLTLAQAVPNPPHGQ